VYSAKQGFDWCPFFLFPLLFLVDAGGISCQLQYLDVLHLNSFVDKIRLLWYNVYTVKERKQNNEDY